MILELGYLDMLELDFGEEFSLEFSSESLSRKKLTALSALEECLNVFKDDGLVWTCNVWCWTKHSSQTRTRSVPTVLFRLVYIIEHYPSFEAPVCGHCNWNISIYHNSYTDILVHHIHSSSNLNLQWCLLLITVNSISHSMHLLVSSSLTQTGARFTPSVYVYDITLNFSVTCCISIT